MVCDEFGPLSQPIQVQQRLGDETSALDSLEQALVIRRQLSQGEDAEVAQQIRLLESKLRDRDQQISWLHVDIAKFQKQKTLLIEREIEIERLTIELEKTRERLQQLLDR